MKGLTRENSNLIGFITKSLAYHAIDRKDVREWAIQTVVNNNVDELPMYIINLMDFDDNSEDIYKIIGFVPTWKNYKLQLNALYGIAVKRGRKLTDINLSDKDALNALEKHPEVEKLFRETFPFIDF